MINQPVFVSIDIGLDTSWDYQFDEDGTLTVLLPVSNVEISSEFMTEQRDLKWNTLLLLQEVLSKE